jgi:hypothetical protein
MRIGKYFAGLMILVGLLVSVGWGQTLFQAGINFDLGFPQDEFKSNIDRLGAGGDFNVALNLLSTPLWIGARLGFLVYGVESWEEPLIYTIPDVFVDVTTTNSIFQAHLLARLQPNRGTVRPYIEGLYGFNHLETNTEIKSQYYDDDDDNIIARSTNFKDSVASFGYGGGILFQIFDGFKLRPKGANRFQLYLDLGAQYLDGGEAEYLKQGSISREGGVVNYDVSYSKTSLIRGYLGLTFCF